MKDFLKLNDLNFFENTYVKDHVENNFSHIVKTKWNINIINNKLLTF